MSTSPSSMRIMTVDAAGIRKLMNDHLYEGKIMTGRIWRLLMFEFWHRNFLERFTKSAGLCSLPVFAESSTTPMPSSSVIATVSRK
jgi:hypothetical protein